MAGDTPLRYDVAILGGGPAAATAGSLLKKYAPQLRVGIFEKERFPRDHVGESLLPAVTKILAEMGAWDKVEAANFPIKLGGTYRWGSTDELWRLDFLSDAEFTEAARPGVYQGQRAATAFQVDRSIYDHILLDHAASLGCDVFQEAEVVVVSAEGDFVTGLAVRQAEKGDFKVKARWYVDGTGEKGVLRRALNLPTDTPTTLRNIAFWDYWNHARWAERYADVATRIQVMSLGWGWMWFIPVGETRTSVGLVLPADYYKATGKRPEELYLQAVSEEPLIAELTATATREGKFETTKDWNYLTGRLSGENWFLIGDSCGFADPILSAGLTLAQTSGRKAAYSILELMRKRFPPAWLKEQYSEGHRAQIREHMRFAEFWYAGNGRFTDLQAHCAEIAASAGLRLSPKEAFAWLGTGGFALDQPGTASAATFPIRGVKAMASHISGGEVESPISGSNMAQANLDGAIEEPFAVYREGAILAVPALRRGDSKLPFGGYFEALLHRLAQPTQIGAALDSAASEIAGRSGRSFDAERSDLVGALEALVLDGWVRVWHDASSPETAFDSGSDGSSR